MRRGVGVGIRLACLVGLGAQPTVPLGSVGLVGIPSGQGMLAPGPGSALTVAWDTATASSYSQVQVASASPGAGFSAPPS